MANFEPLNSNRLCPNHSSAPEVKGGGPRGGPKRWTGNGPRPARHIPWPEIFKHHISVVEGHLKMIDMVRKHTVPESGNWHTISKMVDRTHEILRMSKDVSRNFVPQANQREQVPIGSSSASMYPGYSPADHQYGEAAVEYGQQVQEAKKQGIEFKLDPNGPQYEIGKGNIPRKKLADIRAIKVARGEAVGSGSGSGSDGGMGASIPHRTTNGTATNGVATGIENQEAKNNSDGKDDSNPYFVIDTNPTPVNLPGISHQPVKRVADDEAATDSAQKKPKKAKTKHEGKMPSTKEKKAEPKATSQAADVATKEKLVEFEDISQEVDARMKEKEEKRKRKEEKKRKRESESSVAEAATAAAQVSTEAAPLATEKPKKKKVKKTAEVEAVAGTEAVVEARGKASKKRTGSGDEEGAGAGADDEKKKQKKVKKNK